MLCCFVIIAVLSAVKGLPTHVLILIKQNQTCKTYMSLLLETHTVQCDLHLLRRKNKHLKTSMFGDQMFKLNVAAKHYHMET